MVAPEFNGRTGQFNGRTGHSIFRDHQVLQCANVIMMLVVRRGFPKSYRETQLLSCAVRNTIIVGTALGLNMCGLWFPV